MASPARALAPAAQAVITAALLGILFVVPPFGPFLRDYVIVQLHEVRRLRPLGKSYEERRAAVLGADYRFIAAVRDHTPTDAVIVMPEASRTSPSRLSEQKAKNRAWVQCVLYPRRVLTLGQTDEPLFRTAQWLLVNDPTAVAWIHPSVRPAIEDGQVGLVPFDMGAYLAAVESGSIPRSFLPPRGPHPAVDPPAETPPEAEPNDPEGAG
jgi:hypothetical protein